MQYSRTSLSISSSVGTLNVPRFADGFVLLSGVIGHFLKVGAPWEGAGLHDIGAEGRVGATADIAKVKLASAAPVAISTGRFVVFVLVIRVVIAAFTERLADFAVVAFAPRFISEVVVALLNGAITFMNARVKHGHSPLV